MGGTFCRNEHPLSSYLRVDSPVPFSEIKQKLILELPRATSQPENPPKFWKINTEQKQPSTSQYPVVQNGLQDEAHHWMLMGFLKDRTSGIHNSKLSPNTVSTTIGSYSYEII